MPRNYSVKQTIQILQDGSSSEDGQPIIVGSAENPTILYPIKKKKIENNDEIIKFDTPKDNDPDKKWYQFWK